MSSPEIKQVDTAHIPLPTKKQKTAMANGKTKAENGMY